MRRLSLVTPFGPVSLSEENGALCALHWREGTETSDLIEEGLSQLEAYFSGRLRVFDLPIAFRPGLTGQVQRLMTAIPMGETRTYGQLAQALKTPAQAIGQACGANPLPLVVPCHRVLGLVTIGGFSAPGGVETKAWLLRHEGALLL